MKMECFLQLVLLRIFTIFYWVSSNNMKPFKKQFSVQSMQKTKSMVIVEYGLR